MAALISLISVTILGVTILLSIFDGHITRRTGTLTASLDQTKESLDLANEKLRHMALHDALTNLPNRALLEQRAKEALDRIGRTGTAFAMMFIDLDRFKLINDSLGHQAGDEVLSEVARRIRGRLRHEDTLSRLGGDEFVVLLGSMDRASDAGIVAQKIQACMTEPFRLKGAEMVISASIGISLAPQDGSSVAELLAHADIAMYHAKKLGRNNYQYFAPALNEFAGKRLALEHSLRRAVAEEQFELWYQPKIHISTRRIVGLEALVRWRHPEQGLVMPQEFIPLAEETGLITQLGTWVIRAACRQNRRWRDDGLDNLRIAVNVSAAQFRQPTLVRVITEALEESSLEPEALELEVTESVVMSNPHEAVTTLQQLREMGVSISIDDFGTGYSSLSYLKKFPINTLKVDRTFIRDILSSGDDAAIVKAIVAMAQSLRLNIVAEGVEDSAQLAFLDSIGCDQYQGYFFSRPVPSNVVPTLFDVGAQGDSLSIADAAHDARGAAPASYAPAGSTS
jgi:diguanylate cyclase (GGDEF)-like protein